MAKVYFILALIVQSSLTYAETDNQIIDEYEEKYTSREILKNKPEIDDEVVKDFHEGQKDWMDMFLTTNKGFYPTSSAALMASLANSNKTAEEQLEDIKEMASKITLAIQSEMANLLSYALSQCDKDDEKRNDENSLRRKRETPMDSSQLVMRLLKHIKATNEYQNVAIEKMMTAQEIAAKFGIEFEPDTEVLSDLALAANEQAKEMTSILKDACDGKNATKNVVKDEVEFVPFVCEQNPNENDTFYVYSVEIPEQAFAPHEYMPEPINRAGPVNRYPEHKHSSHHHHSHYETQMPPPPHHMAPVTPKPNFYDSVMPVPLEYPFCPVEQVTTTIVLPIEEVIESEPELIGEEYEETVSSKMIITRDEEPGFATVNHVTTYTINDKAHFKKPEIEKMPQQMQYTFFLM